MPHPILYGPPRFMPMPFRPREEFFFVEIAYFLIVFALCMIIYYRTKDIYKLSKHEGIFHFRNIFLYFAFAYVFRVISMLVMMSTELFEHGLPNVIQPINLLLFGYFSTMAIFSLLMTVFHKRIRMNKLILSSILNLTAIALSLITFITRSHHIMLIIQATLFVIALTFLLLKDGEEDKKKSFLTHNKITFILLFIFWIFNVLTITRNYFLRDLKIPLYIISAGIFFYIFIRVHKRLDLHGKKKG